MKKQTVSDIRWSKDKLISYVLKFTWPQAKRGKVPFISESICKFLNVESRRKRFISGTCNSVQ